MDVAIWSAEHGAAERYFWGMQMCDKLLYHHHARTLGLWHRMSGTRDRRSGLME